MLIVRYPNGQEIRYNSAYCLNRNRDGVGWSIYKDKENKEWVASIQDSAGVIVEAEPACKVSNPAQEDIKSSIRSLRFEIELLQRKINTKNARIVKVKK